MTINNSTETHIRDVYPREFLSNFIALATIVMLKQFKKGEKEDIIILALFVNDRNDTKC